VWYDSRSDDLDTELHLYPHILHFLAVDEAFTGTEWSFSNGRHRINAFDQLRGIKREQTILVDVCNPDI
jgi:hypothetical protein